MILPRVKICGMTNLEDALFCSSAGAEYLGFIFYPQSPRYIDPERAQEIISQLPPAVTPVGVFVNEQRIIIEQILHKTGIQIIQLSGDETPDECNTYPVDVWKAFRIATLEEIHKIESYTVSAILLDGAKGTLYGGTGKKANYEVAREIQKSHRLILAGGLNPDNIIDAITTVSPFAIDMNSGVELSPGKKDHNKVEQVFQKLSMINNPDS